MKPTVRLLAIDPEEGLPSVYPCSKRFVAMNLMTGEVAESNSLEAVKSLVAAWLNNGSCKENIMVYGATREEVSLGGWRNDEGRIGRNSVGTNRIS
jgi:hypothetical protein